MPEPFSIEHFERYAGLLVFDDGSQRGLEAWQLSLVVDLFAGFKRNLWIVPEGNGKALALDTPVPTPDGWTDMGSVDVGDEVFDECGCPCRVVAATEVMQGRPCFRVVFSDRTSVVADAEHLWRVRDVYRDERCRSLDVVRTTAQIAERQRTPNGFNRYSVPRAASLNLPEVMLPVEPYVLGAWLGDGATAAGRVTFGEPFVRDEIASCGYMLGPDMLRDSDRACETRTVLGLSRQLRELGVLGNKHIPPVYLRASRLQRLHLLQGLMDTDGTISTPQGQASLTTISIRLAADMLELVRSLGFKATVRERRAKISGRDCGAAWVVQFHAYDDMPVFRMPRKFARQRKRTDRRSMSETRRIVEVAPVPSVPVRCIQVDAPSQTFLAGEGMVATHNSTLVGMLALYGADYTEEPWIPVGASSAKQAKIIYQQAAGFVRRTPGMVDRFECLDGIKLIRSVRNPGPGIEIYPHDPNTGDGVIPAPWALVDEMHRHPDMRLWDLWAGKLRKRDAQIIGISTAGEPETGFENLREQVRRRARRKQRDGAHLRAEAPGEVLHEWMVAKDELCTDPEAVKAANPLSTIRVENIAADLALVTDLGWWKRVKCNRPTRSSETAISDKEWDDAETARRIPEGAPVEVGLDVAFKWDTTAAVPLWRDGETRVLGAARILTPPRDNSSMHPDEIKGMLLDLQGDYRIETVVMDMHNAEDIAAWIEDSMSVTVIDHDHRRQKTHVEDYLAFMDGLRNGTVKHTGDQGLRAHVLNAIARRLPGGDYRFDRPSQVRGNARAQDKRVIDALSAAAMVVQHSTRAPKKRSVYEAYYATA